MSCALGVFTSPTTLVSLLDEVEIPLKVFVLTQLSGDVLDSCWPEVADGLAEIERLSEDDSFPMRHLASLVASKIYFHLEEYKESLRYGLGAEGVLDLTVKNSYTETIVAKCVEEYVSYRQSFCDTLTASGGLSSTSDIRSFTIPASGFAAPSKAEAGIERHEDGDLPLGQDSRLERVVERLLDQCVAEGEEKEALGVAFECRRLDKVESILKSSKNMTEALDYCATAGISLISNKRFKMDVFRLLISFYDQITNDKTNLSPSYYLKICHCLYNVGDSERFVSIFESLLGIPRRPQNSENAIPMDSASERNSQSENSNMKLKPLLEVEDFPSEDDILIAYQIAFYLVEQGNQSILQDILSHRAFQLAPEPQSFGIDGSSTAFLGVKGSATSQSGQANNDEAGKTKRDEDPMPCSGSGISRSAGGNDCSGDDADGRIADKDGRTKVVNKDTDTSTSASYNDVIVAMPTSAEADNNEENYKVKTCDSGESAAVDDRGASIVSGDVNRNDACTSDSSSLVEKHEGDESSGAAGSEGKKTLSHRELIKTLRSILTCEASVDLELRFLHRSNRTDLVSLDNIRKAADQRSSVIHTAIVMAHSLMQAGTTCDSFLRYNLEWLSKASCWAKFGATASLGVIHKGHGKESRNVLSTYLPGSGHGGGAYAESGSLYALGLIHANHCDEPMKEYLLQQLRAAHNSEVLQHGACLGLGLVALGTADDTLYDQLKTVLFMDSAVAGEAAAIAIGLVMLGTGSERAISDLLAYVRDTQHEKITRSCMLALAFVMYQRGKEVDVLADQLYDDKDVVLRFGAVTTLGMAYCGTSDNSAVKRLLHATASDVADDVRRGAVFALGFVLCDEPDTVLQVMSMLSDSFHPHVRYASALATGIACAGSAKEDVVDLLMPMTHDTTDFVRQGALMALGLVLMQTSNERMPSSVGNVREDVFFRIATDKHEDIITRLGAIVAHGLIDAGGRNVAASLFSSSGVLRRQAVVGFTLFTQLWYWFPLVYCVSLSFRPTALIALTRKLEMPRQFSISCGAPTLHMFDYPPPSCKEKREEKREAFTAVLSTTKKHMTQDRRRIELSSTFGGSKAPLAQQKDTTFLNLKGDTGKATYAASLLMSDDVSSQQQPDGGADISSIAATQGESAGAPTETEIGSTTSTDPKAISEKAVDSVDNFMEDEEMLSTNGEQQPSSFVATITSNGSLLTDDDLHMGNQANCSIDDNENRMAKRRKSGSIAKTPNDNTVDVTSRRQGSSSGLPSNIRNATTAAPVILMNPCRVLPMQEQHLSYFPDGRYYPIVPERKSGFIMLRDSRPQEAEDFVKPEGETQEANSEGSNPKNGVTEHSAASMSDDERSEPSAPAPFEWNG